MRADLAKIKKFIRNHADVRWLLSLRPAKKYPFNSYIGINYNKRGLKNVKLYFAFYEKLPIGVIGSYLPVTKHFKEYYSSFQAVKERSLKDTGFCLSFKVDIQLNVTKGYHFRIPGKKKPTERALGKLNVLNLGVCEEFKGEKVHEKNYFYYADDASRTLFARRYGKPYLRHATLLEYTESDNNQKLISINAANDPAYSKLFKPDFKVSQDILSHFNKRGLSSSLVYGIYHKSDTRAMYLYNLKRANERDPFALPENFHIHTVDKWLNAKD